MKLQALSPLWRCFSYCLSVWSDVEALRLENMPLTLCGSLPRSSRQNNLFGLPAVLSACQVATLRDKGRAEVTSTLAHRDVTSDEHDRFWIQREQNARVQANEMLAVRQQQIAEGVRRHLERSEMNDDESTAGAARCSASSNSGHDQAEESSTMAASGAQCSASAELDNDDMSCDRKDKVVASTSSRVQSSSSSSTSTSPAVQQSVIVRTMIGDSFPPIPLEKFDYPRTESECQRWMVFKHLTDQGYHLCSGLNFGADFIMYKGDPLLVHSCAIVLVVPHSQKMSLTRLVAAGRLASKARKTVLLASYTGRWQQPRPAEHLRSSEDESGVRCVTFQWSGIH
eukprot:scpid74680/ scgid5625/ tRNA-splicing endonuclease subunit Sen34; Leukocyte receptor cluster member 5; tRNA-intron endonuclease Sen34